MSDQAPFQISPALRDRLKRVPTRASGSTGLYIVVADGPEPQNTSYNTSPTYFLYRDEVDFDDPFLWFQFEEPIEDVVVVDAANPENEGLYDPSRSVVDGALVGLETNGVRATVDGTVTGRSARPIPGCVEFWMKTIDNGPAILITITADPAPTGDQELTLTLNADGTLTAEVYDVVPTPTFLRTVTSTIEANDGDWHHIVVNNTSEDFWIYQDGVNVS